MKLKLFLSLLLCYSIITNAQIYNIYDSAIRYRMAVPTFSVAADTLIARSVASGTDEGENPSYILTRWKNFISNRICNDVPLGADMYSPMGGALNSYISFTGGGCSGTGFTGNWQCLGPFLSTYGSVDSNNVEQQGRITSLWVDPDNDSIILAGADCGGLWKSTTNGYSWFNLTDGDGSNSVLGLPGVNCIAVNPLNKNDIYITLESDGDQNTKAPTYSLGLAYTTDGGTHWATDTALTSLIGAGPAISIGKISYMPGTQQLFALYGGHVYMKANPTATWTDITPGDSMSLAWCTDMDFSRITNYPTVITSENYGSSSLWQYNGTSWSRMVMILPGTYSMYNAPGAAQFSMSSEDTAFIKFIVYNSSYTSVETLFVKTPITSFDPTILENNFLSTITNFKVSPANSNLIYATNYLFFYEPGGAQIYPAPILKSTDGGISFDTMAAEGHPDGRCLFIAKTTNTINGINDEIFYGTDGGVREKRPGHIYCESITGTGLAITQFYGLGNTEADADIIVSGAQDDGTFCYIKSRPTSWVDVFNDDGYTAKIMKNNILQAWTEDNSIAHGTYIPTKFTFYGDSIGHKRLQHMPNADSPISNINRPIYFAPDNTGYLGYCHIWKMVYGDSIWANAFYKDPIDHGSYTNKLLVADFYIDENDNDSAYILYRGTSTNPLNDTFGRLYFSSNSQNAPPSAPPTWTSITPLIDTVNNITSIAVDPNNASRIWVAFGNINNSLVGTNSADMQNRVWHSEDAGSNWTDVSTGLSALPVNKLLYRKGSNDEIYAGTDVGVFKWNPATGNWQCFNTGLPTCIVMDMEFNYCAGKLRVATYGRGIWETPIENISPGTVPSTNITGTTLWNQNMWLESSVIVQPGGWLIISSDTVHMPKGSTITVEPGGHLSVNDAEITNSCDQCYWQGIIAKGNSSLPQSPVSNQGYVNIQGGSTITNAVTGVSNAMPDGSNAGGIIIAFNSNFVNNQNAVTLLPYSAIAPGTATANPYLAHFVNCTFLLDNNYKGNAAGSPAFNNFVSLNGVDGVNFGGTNQFLNRDTFSAFRLKGDGIYSYNSSFGIGGVCSSILSCYPLLYPRFCGLTNGIEIENSSSFDLASGINGATFDSVSVGINVNSNNNVAATQCSFLVGHGLSTSALSEDNSYITLCHQNIGILLQNTPQFITEGNDFEGITAPYDWFNIGVAAVNTQAVNRIYRNTFNNLSYGVYALGANRMPGGNGLTIQCNTFTYNSASDIYVDQGASPVSLGMVGIQGTQGSAGSPAGNTFSSSAVNLLNASSNPVSYYYNSAHATTPPVEKPGIVTPLNVYVYGISYSNSCLPTYGVTDAPYPPPAGSLSLGHLRAHKNAFYTNSVQYQDTLAFYMSLIDFGNTDSVINLIQTSSDTAALMGILSSGSPYISAAALNAAGARAKLPYYSMMQLLKQNPDDLHDGALLSNMRADYSLDSADMDSLAATATHTTPRTNTELAIAMAKDAMDAEGNVIMTALKSPTDTNMTDADSSLPGICTDSASVYYMLDSNAYYAGFDSINAWLQNIGELWTNYERVGYYNYTGTFGRADSIYQWMGTILPPGSEADSTTYSTFGQLWGAIKSADDGGRNIYSLNSTDLVNLDTSTIPVYTYNTAIKKIYALSLSLTGGTAGVGPAPGGEALVPLCVGTETEGGRKGHSNTNNALPVNNTYSVNDRFSAYPNPTNGIVTFAWNVPDDGGQIRIAITNITGVTVKALTGTGKQGNLNWDTRGMAAGVYLYEASSDKGIISKGKLIVMP